MVLRSSLLDLTGWPFTEVMTSPVRMPALSAGEPSTTCDTSAPMALLRPSECAMSGVTVYMLTPSWPRLTSPYLISCSMTLRAMLTGMAKPMPMLPPLRERIAVLMPISSPRRLTSAPPELPGLIEASVWMKSS